MTILPAAVTALRELITKWRSSPNAISPRQIDQCADALDALLARVEPQELPELPSWMPSTSELLQHMTLYRALRAAVDALDPAAADNRLYIEWDAAKWAVFNAAVRLVKETASDIGASVEPEQEHNNGSMQTVRRNGRGLPEWASGDVSAMSGDRQGRPEVARVEPPPQEQGSVQYWLTEAVHDLNRARGEITTQAEDRLIDVCGALIAALAAPPSPPTQEPT